MEPEQTLYKILNTHVPLACFYGEGKCHLEELHQSLLKKCWFLYRSSTLYFRYSYCFQVDLKSCLKSHTHKRYVVSLLLNNLKIHDHCSMLATICIHVRCFTTMIPKKVYQQQSLLTFPESDLGMIFTQSCVAPKDETSLLKDCPFHTKDILPPILQNVAALVSGLKNQE